MELHLGILLSTLIKEEKMGGATKTWLQMLSFTEKKYNLFCGKSESNYTTNMPYFVIMLGTILIDSDLLVQWNILLLRIGIQVCLNRPFRNSSREHK